MFALSFINFTLFIRIGKNMSILSFITDVFALFLDSLTTVEEVIGIYNLNLGGLVIEHPLAFLVLIPLFILSFFIGLNHSRFGFFFILVAVGFVVVTFIITVGFGIDPITIISFAFVLFTIPTTFVVGFFIGWGFQQILRVICTDREGGLFCRFNY